MVCLSTYTYISEYRYITEIFITLIVMFHFHCSVQHLYGSIKGSWFKEYNVITEKTIGNHYCYARV